MSQSSQPTISYVLPVYETLHAHLSNAIAERKLHIRIRQGARPALEKLQKYREKALDNHYLKLGVGESLLILGKKIFPLTTDLNLVQSSIPLFALNGSEISLENLMQWRVKRKWTK
jgi:hypothetical protein